MKKYICCNCGYSSRKYTNFCPNCGEKFNQDYVSSVNMLTNTNERKVHINIYWLIANIIIWPTIFILFYFLISTGFFDRITMFITNTY